MLTIAEKKKLLNQILVAVNGKLVAHEHRRGGAADLLAEHCRLSRRQIDALKKEGTTRWTKDKTEELIWEFARQRGFSLPPELLVDKHHPAQEEKQAKPSRRAMPPEEQAATRSLRTVYDTLENALMIVKEQLSHLQHP